MKKIQNAAVCVILFCVLCFGLMHTEAYATTIVANGLCGSTPDIYAVSWSLDSEGTLKISGSGDMYDFDHRCYYPIWHNYVSEIQSVIVEEGVTSIGSDAFIDCRALRSVTIPESVTKIGSGAFKRCQSLKQIQLPKGIKSIESSTFQYCYSLTDIVIPDTVTSIGDYAFEYCCAMESITIPASLVSIGKYAFNYAFGLNRSIYFRGTKAAWNSIDVGIQNDPLFSSGTHIYYGKGSSIFVTGQPADQLVKAGTTAKFTATTKGTVASYQWQYKTTSSGSWKNSTLSSAKKKTLNVSATTGRSGYYYRCKITDANGKSTYTDSARLYVLGIKTQPSTQKVKAGVTVSFKVSATGSGKTYQWQYKTSSSGSWNNSTVSSAQKATLKVSATTGKSGYYYRCKIKDSAGNTVYTNAVRLYVLGVTSQPSNKTVSNGKIAKFKVAATGAGKTYQWQYSKNGGKTWKNTTLSGYKTTTLSVKGNATRNGYYYRCRITDSAGNVVYSNKAKLTVK